MSPPNPPLSPPPAERFGLKSLWDDNPSVYAPPVRVQGTVEEIEVLGEIPTAINGTFYRIMVDPFYPPNEDRALPIEGDGVISAFHIYNGKVDMRTRYVETERYLLERKAGKRLFGNYRNPYTHHPCVRAAVESTANTNLVWWAGHLLALKENGLPYVVDPNNLKTIIYDPFKGQVQSKTFTAHPKVDPFSDELVVFGYEAKGLGSSDIVIYGLNTRGVKTAETWIKSPFVSFIHDCAVTENFVILLLLPYEANVEVMKAGGQHWNWNDERPMTFLVVPRPGKKPSHAWQTNEARSYVWENCTCLHAGAAFEKNGKIYFDAPRIFYNTLGALQAKPWVPPSEWNADYARFEIDPTQRDGSKVSHPQVLLGVGTEFPRIDERFLTKETKISFVCALKPNKETPAPLVPLFLNSYALINTETGTTTYFDPGPMTTVQEPIFIPRYPGAPEGDGFVIGMVERLVQQQSDLVVIDTNDFTKPVAIVKLPFRVQGQIHGNWVEAAQLPNNGAVAEERPDVDISGRGPLESEGVFEIKV